MERFESTVAGLWIVAGVYAMHYAVYPFWRRTEVVRWLRIPLSIAAWIGVAAIVLPAKGFGEALVRFAEHPNMGSLGEVGVYGFLAILIGFLYQNGHAFGYDRIMPFIRDSLTLRHSIRVRDDIFAKAEMKEIEEGMQSEADRKALDAPSRRARIDTERELKDLQAQRVARIRTAGEAERERLAGGEPADLTEVFKLLHLHRFPHPRLETTFRVVVDPVLRRCSLSTLFDGVRPSDLKDADHWFRFRQEMFDILQVFLSEDWTRRFRPYFDSVALICHVAEQDSFGLPRQRPFLSALMPVAIVDKFRGRIFIATEFENNGSIEWFEEEST